MNTWLKVTLMRNYNILEVRSQPGKKMKKETNEIKKAIRNLKSDPKTSTLFEG
jgi:hypothetical protein